MRTSAEYASSGGKETGNQRHGTFAALLLGFALLFSAVEAGASKSDVQEPVKAVGFDEEAACRFADDMEWGYSPPTAFPIDAGSGTRMRDEGSRGGEQRSPALMIGYVLRVCVRANPSSVRRRTARSADQGAGW